MLIDLFSTWLHPLGVGLLKIFIGEAIFIPLGGVIACHRAIECLVSVSNCVICVIYILPLLLSYKCSLYDDIVVSYCDKYARGCCIANSAKSLFIRLAIIDCLLVVVACIYCAKTQGGAGAAVTTAAGATAAGAPAAGAPAAGAPATAAPAAGAPVAGSTTAAAGAPAGGAGATTSGTGVAKKATTLASGTTGATKKDGSTAKAGGTTAKPKSAANNGLVSRSLPLLAAGTFIALRKSLLL